MHNSELYVWIFGSLVTAHVLCSGNVAQPLNCSSSQETCSDGNMCILRHWICDGEQDCLDGSDEEDCVRCLPSRWMCADSRQCIPEEWRCDGQADCNDESDEGACNNEVFVIIADYHGEIHKIDPKSGEDTILFQDSYGPQNLAYDRKTKHIYWSDTDEGVIQRIHIDASDHGHVVDVDSCKGLVVDHVSRLLFYTSQTTLKVYKFDLKTNQSTAIITSPRTRKPHDITADLKTKKLYWTGIGRIPGIEMSDYYGRDRITLLAGAIHPIALAMDSTGTTLLWLDGRTQKSHVMGIDLATRTSRSLWHAESGNFIDIAVYNSTFYLIDKYQRSDYFTVPETGGALTRHQIAEASGDGRSLHISVFAKTWLPCSHN